MPNNIVKSFAKKTGKPESEVEGLWDKAKGIVTKDYPEIEKGSEKFYKLLTGVLKKMLSIKTEDGGEGGNPGIAYSDIAAGTTTPFNTYIKHKRKYKKELAECCIPLMSMDEQNMFLPLQQMGMNDVAIDMLKSSISDNQLADSIQDVKIGEQNTSVGSDMLYLNSRIVEAQKDKHKFSAFTEDFVLLLLKATSLNESNEAYGYDLQLDNTLISVKSSSTKRGIKEAYRNSSSIKTTALILSALQRYDEGLYSEFSNFKDIDSLLNIKETVLTLALEADLDVVFSVSYIDENDEFCTHLLHPVSEHQILSEAFSIIENSEGKAKSIMFSTFTKLCEFCTGETITTIKLLPDAEYLKLREQFIEKLSSVKDADLMSKIMLLLK